MNAQRKWTYFADQSTKYIVQFAGVVVILAVLAIPVFICIEIFPLCSGGVADTKLAASIETNALDVGGDERGAIGYVVRDSGIVDFLSLTDGRVLASVALEGLENGDPTAVARTKTPGLVGIGTSKGRVLLMRIVFSERPPFDVSLVHSWQLGAENEQMTQLVMGYHPTEQWTIAALTDQNRLLYLQTHQERAEHYSHDLSTQVIATPTAIALTADGKNLLVGTQNGWLYHWNINDPQAPHRSQRFQIAQDIDVPITALTFLIGDSSLVVGDGEGNVDIYFQVSPFGTAGQPRFQKIRRFEGHNGAITHIVASPKNRAFLTANDMGKVQLCFSTSHRRLLRYQKHSSTIAALAFTPTADAALSLDVQGTLRYWHIDSAHPDISFGTLFEKVWYENDSGPKFVWESTKVNQNETKRSVMPLIFGTFKATLYAMLFAVPMALLSAFYTSECTAARLKAVVQPAIELVASVPGVVIGFLAAVWLAPYLEQVLVTIFLMVIIMPTTIVGAALLWRFVPKPTRNRISTEQILVPIGALIFVSIIVSQFLSGAIENTLFDGDVIQWLAQTLGITYENRNAIIVGLALGLAVTPTIYTRAYHALVNVPQGLVSDALALGATRPQVALSVVLPTAVPGIFVAIMVGFSRAVGETMIVLLASNNTPIFDWHIFSGMQTMSAAIAGIMPAIPRGETLYRVLFLIGGLLFLFTFVINVLSDLVGAYLRKQYHQFERFDPAN